MDHCFQRTGFDKHRLFYTQGDYGLLQSSKPSGASAHKTYDNYDIIRKMVLSEGCEISDDGDLIIPENTEMKMKIPSDLIPYCPDDGALMTTNLRSDDSFVEDAGWHAASGRYHDFLRRHEHLHVLYLELGVGMNTPVIVKFRFRNETLKNKNAVYACINKGEAHTVEQIADRSIVIDADISDVIRKL